MKTKLLTMLLFIGVISLNGGSIKIVDDFKKLKDITGTIGQLALVKHHFPSVKYDKYNRKRINTNVNKYHFSWVRYIYDGTNWLALQDADDVGAPQIANIDTMKSCKEIKTAIPSAEDGIYFIDPDGNGTRFEKTKVYCDMTNDGGGWTLFAHINRYSNYNEYFELFRADYPSNFNKNYLIDYPINSVFKLNFGLGSIFNNNTEIRKVVNPDKVTIFKLKDKNNYCYDMQYYTTSYYFREN